MDGERWMEGWIERWMERYNNGWIQIQINGCKRHGRMGGQTDGWKEINWMDESIDGWVDRNIGGWTVGQRDIRIYV